ncbi:hypothetical protein C4D60_Mb11t22200 [Musa balbisiana]|uniref:pyruvate decarboxylase n=1 Tax=Musa balbisiana TaxID=52838 RepID=A0A4S8J607_MUSBA|nr:hypothetical protein C4D60_Mb11t22200 [Musa balbisiana]
MGLEAAVEATVEFLSKAVKPVLVGGPKIRMQYGSIGWSVGATLGYAQAVKNRKRVIACIGDGSFQVPLPILMLRRQVPRMASTESADSDRLTSAWTAGDSAGRVDDAAVRAEQHHLPHQQRRVHHRGGDPRRTLQCHQKLELRRPGGRHPQRRGQVLDDEGEHSTRYTDGRAFAVSPNVRYEEELKEAIATAAGAKQDCLCFIEVIVHKDDTSKELLEWGSRVCSANSRAPNPQ